MLLITITIITILSLLIVMIPKGSGACRRIPDSALFSLFVLVMFPNGVITVRLSPLIPKGAGAC